MSKRIVKKLALLATAVTVLVGGAVAVPSTANAATSQCGSGYACGWDYENYSGEILSFSSGNANFGGMNDRISSIFNNGNYQYARWYQDANYVGLNLGQPMKSQIAGLQPWGFNNSFSSGRFTSP